jgi:hypothetical protein
MKDINKLQLKFFINKYKYKGLLKKDIYQSMIN